VVYVLGLGLAAYLLAWGIIIFAFALAYLLLAAVILIPSFFLARLFYRQITQKYRLTWSSELVLFLVGLSSVLGAFNLVSLSGDPKALACLFMIPLFLVMATATLGLWGLLKLFPLWWSVFKAERVKAKSRAKVYVIINQLADLSTKKTTLKKKHGIFLKEREGYEARLRELCTQAGDQRVRTLFKERLERDNASLTITELEEKLKPIQKRPFLTENDEMLKCLLNIALIDARTGKAQALLTAEEQNMESLTENKQELERIQADREHRVDLARQALRRFKAQRIILD